MEQLNNHQSNNDIQVFLDLFKKKGKRNYKWYKSGLKGIARQISPAYRDFDNKVLVNGKLKFTRSSDGACQTTIELSNSLSRRALNTIRFDYYDGNTFLHELGHSIDFMFGSPCQLTGRVFIQDDKTMMDIFEEEFDAHKAEIKDFIMNEYRFSIDSNIHKGAYDILIKYMPTYKKLCDCENPKERKKLQKELYECGFVEVYYQIATKKCFKVMTQKYESILDALSSIQDNYDLFLPGHSMNYYHSSPRVLVSEFFANVFADKIMANHDRFDQLIKLMPKSFNAFERLFVIIYDHIQNNKRFTDLKIRPIKHYDDEEDESEVDA